MSAKEYYQNQLREFLIKNKLDTKQSQVVFAIDRDHARAIGERTFNTDAKNIQVKKL